MRAAWYEKQGPAHEVLMVGEMPDPRPGAGEVRIRIAASGINPGDVKKRQDSFGVACLIRASFRTAMGQGASIRLVMEYLPIGWVGRCGVTARSLIGRSVPPQSSRLCRSIMSLSYRRA
jgi:hypothetical protein